MNAPFAATAKPLPVTVVTDGPRPMVGAGVALITIEDAAGHDHGGGECLVCNTRGNVRVLLFELLEQARQGAVLPFTSVVVDARKAADPRAVVDALVPGKLPAFGMRDHTVARSFILA
jgi:hypothetical protein